MWLLDPNVVANSSVATTDVGSAAVALYATYAFRQSLLLSGRRVAVASGVGLGLALSSKFSLLALPAAWFVLATAARLVGVQPEAARSRAFRLGLIGAVGALTLCAAYGFEGVMRPLGSFSFRSRMMTGLAFANPDSPPLGNRFRPSVLGALPVPLPENYVLGLDSQKSEEEIGLLRLDGVKLVRGGRWHSPFRSLALKTPPGTLILLALTPIIWLARRPRPRVDDLAVIVTPLILLGALCTQTGLNWPYRYALPALPFLYIAAGGGAQALWRGRIGKAVVVACLAWNAAELIIARPSPLAYGNGMAGGPAGADKYFNGSNYDWGQDLYRLKQWADSHPEATPLATSYYGVLDPAQAGLATIGLPRGFVEGEPTIEPAGGNGGFFWAISANVLNGMPCWNDLDGRPGLFGAVHAPGLRKEDAMARVGFSIYIFHVVPDGRREAPGHPTIPAIALVGCLRELESGILNSAP